MAKLKVTAIGMEDFVASSLEQFKSYASVSDGTQDELLCSMLRAAVLKVQEYADRAIVACDCKQTSILGSGTVYLYLGGGTVSGVRQDGADCAFEQTADDCVRVSGIADRNVEISFVAEATEDYSELIPHVLRYATALYDGEDPKVLKEILGEISIC